MIGVGSIVGAAVGVFIGAAGLYVIRFNRVREEFDAAEDRAAAVPGRMSSMLGWMSIPSRMLVGMSLLILGYHLVSYSLPTGWLWLRVPPERLWILGLAVVVAVGGSLMMDRLERR